MAFSNLSPHEPCPPPDPRVDLPTFNIPSGACDCHAHAFSNDRDAYPLVAARPCTPPAAPEADYLGMLIATNMMRGVLVQPRAYGSDNRYMLGILARHPDMLRGVAVVDPDVDDAELRRMDALGVRGIRVDMLFNHHIGVTDLRTLALKISRLGWHMELLLDARHLPEMLPLLAHLHVPLVIDHMGNMPAGLGTESDGFQALLELVVEHGAWVKLSGAYRIDAGQDHYKHAEAFAQALAKVGPERLLYGSDWPHIAPPYFGINGMPNTGRMRNLIGEWFSSQRMRHRIFFDNPARLYGF
ncbi:amidohydrolase family protein [Phytohalomonas tamaricis]|uniref:amidohydrolase family protein n=1 Tax=Phytohalomonas tamaricis TaxID=2081032 RepID=UPI000D0B494E|nr:amidohydrolase family protein [Phytohalomonas tamaricis]